MISHRLKYAMLMASLPPHNRNLFNTKQTPISQIQLNKRLQWLEPQDADDLAKIEGLLHWSKLTECTDRHFIEKSNEILAGISNLFLINVIVWRLEVRTIISALRKQHQGIKVAPEKDLLGFGKWPFFIGKNWQQEDFAIGRQLPWIKKARQLIASNNSLELEKMLLEMVWLHYERQGNGHYFDFEAVIIYVLRWDVINRWSKYNKQQGKERFAAIMDSKLQGVFSQA